MKKFMIFLFLFCAPVFGFGQNQFQGFYQAQFFNLLGSVKIIRADFEVKADGTIAGKIEAGGAVKTFQGQAAKEKFEARTATENGVTTIIKGEFPNGKKEGKISLVQRSEQKGGGSKSISENGINGFLKQIPPPEKLEDLKIADTGKTLLWIQHANSFFDKEWVNAPISTAKISNVTRRAAEIEIRSSATNPARRFKFRVSFIEADQNVWEAAETGMIIYSECKNDAAGNCQSINLFTGGNNEESPGKIELISETADEMVFKITNLKIKKVGEESFVQIDGYIHAAKNKS